MNDGLARLGVFHPVGADHVHAHGSGEAKIQRTGGGIFAPDLDRGLLEDFFQIQGISVDSHFNVANCMPGGEIADSVTGEKQNHFGFAGCLSQVPQGAPLIGRKPVFQKVDIVRHSVPVQALAALPSI